jgi:hypothetical protein
LAEEHRLRVFENRVLRRIFGPKREEDGSWRKLHSDELHSLDSSPNIVRVIKPRRMRWEGHVARMWEGRGVYMSFYFQITKTDHNYDGHRYVALLLSWVPISVQKTAIPTDFFVPPGRYWYCAIRRCV